MLRLKNVSASPMAVRASNVSFDASREIVALSASTEPESRTRSKVISADQSVRRACIEFLGGPCGAARQKRS